MFKYLLPRVHTRIVTVVELPLPNISANKMQNNFIRKGKRILKQESHIVLDLKDNQGNRTVTS